MSGVIYKENTGRRKRFIYLLVYLCGWGGRRGIGHNSNVAHMNQDPPEGKPSHRLEYGNHERSLSRR